ncbi:MAG: dephospho-CoA kinase [Anaerolineae bacterium]|jgi:dephospho-CoA kinase
MREVNGGRPVMIGLTGNIGTGKSTVAEMLAGLGAEVIDADEVAHEVIRPGTTTHALVAESFGPEILNADGGIDRERLGAIVFASAEDLCRLEAIVHPVTLAAIECRIDATRSDVVVIEAIKLIESGLADDCDTVWVTTCRVDQQIERIMTARGLSRSEAEQRVVSQPPQEEKIARADVVIDNAGSLSVTRVQVKAAWERTTQKTKGSASLSWK